MIKCIFKISAYVMLLLMIWNGLKIDVSIGKANFNFEVYAFGRFFRRNK